MNGKFDEDKEAQYTPPQGVTELTRERDLTTDEKRCDYRQKEALVNHLKVCKQREAQGQMRRAQQEGGRQLH